MRTASPSLAHDLALTSLVPFLSRAPAFPQPPPAQTLDDVWLLDAEGERVAAIEALAPGPTLIIFWRLDSKPSREAMIHLHHNRLRLEMKVSRVVGITDERRGAALEFLNSQGIQFPIFYDADQSLASAYEVGYVFPSLVLVDRELAPVGREEGGGESFDHKLRRLLDTSLPKDHETGRVWIIAVAVAVIAVLGAMVAR